MSEPANDWVTIVAGTGSVSALAVFLWRMGAAIFGQRALVAEIERRVKGLEGDRADARDTHDVVVRLEERVNTILTQLRELRKKGG